MTTVGAVALSTASRCDDDNAGALDASTDVAGARSSDVQRDITNGDANGDACASVTSDWPGYARYTALSPCARVDTPNDAAASVPALAWVPCSTGLSGCMQMNVTWPGDQGTFFGPARVATNATGQPTILNLYVARDHAQVESCIYDFNSSMAITSWRFQADQVGDFSAYVTSTADAAALNALNSATQNWTIGTGSLGALLGGQGLTSVPTNVIPLGTGIQFDALSSTTYAFDTGASGLVDRVAIGTTAFVVGKAPAILSRPVVHGDDVYAYASQGTDGWPRYYRVDSDGGVIDYLTKTSHFFSGLATDTQHVCWVDGYGNAQPTTSQPTVEVWCAPYSSDPTLVSTQGTKVATMSNGGNVGQAVAFAGYWVGLMGLNDAWVVRMSDGSNLHIVPESGRRFQSVGYVNDHEVWLIESASPGAAGVAFERVPFSM